MEVVRRGLAPAVAGARVLAVEVRDARALKRHRPRGGAARSGVGVTLRAGERADRQRDFEHRLTGAVLAEPVRRGKFLWVPVVGRGEALLAHLGMSGQLLLRAVDADDDRHVRIRLWIAHPAHGELRLDFADQRLFGSLALDTLVPLVDAASGPEVMGERDAHAVGEGAVGGTLGAAGPAGATGAAGAAPFGLWIPGQAAHIAPDPLEAVFDAPAVVEVMRSRSRGVKHLLLDQALVSGIGNIYADEALWAARVHPETPGNRLSAVRAHGVLRAVREVFERALAEGGTSFDAQYVNVNGEAGYFAHSLHAYGRTGEPCARCGALIKRIPFAGRSSHFCPRCQRRR